MDWILIIYLYASVPFREPNLHTAGNGGPAIEHIEFKTYKECKRVGKLIRKSFGKSKHVKPNVLRES